MLCTVQQKILEGINLELLNCGYWQILILQICCHVPLSMHIMAQNGGFYFDEWLLKRQICQI